MLRAIRVVTCAAAAVLALGTPAVGRAQWGRGVVVDVADVPVSGVVVQLLDSARKVVARALTDERGQFSLLAPGDADYTIATLRIGFRPTTAGPFAMRRGEAVTRRLALSGIPVGLDTVRVTGSSVCGRAVADSAAVTFAAWEQVRAALTATDLSTGASGVMATIVAYRRSLDALGKSVERQELSVHTDLVRQPWTSRPVPLLHELGFVNAMGDSTVFYAPGLDMLTSQTFAEDHCLRLTSSRDKSQLGIAFEPTRERRNIKDIKGTLWLDRASAQLRRLEYRYTNLSVDEEHAGTGGAMEFARMANGAWAISRWNIRMPVVERRFRVNPVGRRTVTSTSETIVSALQVDGGELALVWRGADTLWRHEPVSVNGSVNDSSSGRAVVNARVLLLGTAMQATTDASGRFTIPGVIPGEYALEVHTKGLDSLGTATRVRAVVTEGAPPVEVHVPSPDALTATLCGRRFGTSAAAAGIIVGTARVEGASAAPRHLKVTASWMDAAAGVASGAAAERSRRFLDASTDASGNFRLCGVPVGTVLVVTAASDDGSAPPVAMQLSADSRLSRTAMLIDPLLVAGAEFAGIVTDSAGQPVADAEVVISALHKSLLTTQRGEFRLRDITPGTYTVLVRKVGWGPLNVLLTFGVNQTVEHRVILTRVTVLEEVTVTAPSNLPWKREFEENRRLGLGHFLTREDLAKREGQTVEALMAEMPGADVMLGRGSRAWLTNRRGPRGTPFSPGGEDSLFGARPGCYANVYLDNLPIFIARPGESLFDLHSISVDRIEAIEYYAGPAQTPLKYSSLRSQCGVIVIRTRTSP